MQCTDVAILPQKDRRLHMEAGHSVSFCRDGQQDLGGHHAFDVGEHVSCVEGMDTISSGATRKKPATLAVDVIFFVGCSVGVDSKLFTVSMDSDYSRRPEKRYEISTHVRHRPSQTSSRIVGDCSRSRSPSKRDCRGFFLPSRNLCLFPRAGSDHRKRPTLDLNISFITGSDDVWWTTTLSR